MAKVGAPVGFQFEIEKADHALRQVWGYAAAESPDKQGDMLDFDGLKDAFAAWFPRGNVRLAHDHHRPIGKCISWHPDEAKRAIYVGIQLSRTPDGDAAYQMVKEGTLTGMSVKGAVLAPPTQEIVKTATGTSTARRIRKWRMDELSLVDNPCHDDANIDLVKAAGATTPQDDVDGVTPEPPVPAAPAVPAPGTPQWGSYPEPPRVEVSVVEKTASPHPAAQAMANAPASWIMVPGLPYPVEELRGTGMAKVAQGPQQGTLISMALVTAMLEKAAAPADENTDASGESETPHQDGEQDDAQDSVNADAVPDADQQKAGDDAADRADASTAEPDDTTGDLVADDEGAEESGDDDQTSPVEKAAATKEIIAMTPEQIIAAITQGVAAAIAQVQAPQPVVEKAAAVETAPADDTATELVKVVDGLTAKIADLEGKLEKAMSLPAPDTGPAVRDAGQPVVVDKSLNDAPAAAESPFDLAEAAFEKAIASTTDPREQERLRFESALIGTRRVFSGQ